MGRLGDGRDYRFIQGFDPDRVFELPPNKHHPREYAFWAGESYDVVAAADCDYLRGEDPVFVVHVNGVHRAYPWVMASKPHAINTEADGEPFVTSTSRRTRSFRTTRRSRM